MNDAIISAVNTVSVNTDAEVINCIFLISSFQASHDFKILNSNIYILYIAYIYIIYADAIIWLSNSQSFYQYVVFSGKQEPAYQKAAIS